MSGKTEPTNEQPEPVTAVADAIAETQDAIAEHVETPVQDRDSEWQTQFQAMTAKLEKLDQTLLSIVTKLDNPPNPKPETESAPPNESNAQEAVLEIDSGESDQRETKQKTRGRNPKRLRLQKLATNRR